MNTSRDPVHNLAHAMQIFIKAAGRIGQGEATRALPVLGVIEMDTLLHLSGEVRTILFETASQANLDGKETTPLFDAVAADLQCTDGTTHETPPGLQCRAGTAWPTVDEDDLLNV